MKLIFIIYLAILFIFSAHGSDLTSEFDNPFGQASLPNFLPLVGKALPGRCYLTSGRRGSNKKIASVLMVSFEEEGFEVAPFDADKKREDIFDNMTYEEVLKEFPMIKKMFLDINETALGAVIYKTINNNEYRGELRESNKYILLRIFLDNKLYKYCNYNTALN